MVLDRLAERLGTGFKQVASWKSEMAQADSLTLMKPLTWMNRSGDAVAPYARYHKIGVPEILVVYDDVALPVGKIRLRRTGSAGGHNGLQSILNHFHTREIPRLRIGVGNVNSPSLVGHVLGDFPAEDWKNLPEVFERAVDAILDAHQYGVEIAMNRYN